MFESLKDPNTGQLKKPILISMVVAGGLVLFLLIRGKGSGSSGVVSTGLTTPLTPDLTGLADALKKLNQSNQGGIAGVPASGTSQPTDTTGLSNYQSPPPYLDDTPSTPTSPPIPGSDGTAGGGGGGTGQVIYPIAKDPSVYGGFTLPPYVAPGGQILSAQSATQQEINAANDMLRNATPVAQTTIIGVTKSISADYSAPEVAYINKTISARAPRTVAPAPAPVPLVKSGSGMVAS